MATIRVSTDLKTVDRREAEEGVTDHQLEVLFQVVKDLGIFIVALTAYVNARTAHIKAEEAIRTCSFPECGHKCGKEG